MTMWGGSVTTGSTWYMTCPVCGLTHPAGSSHVCAVALPPVDLKPVQESLAAICQTLQRIAEALDRLK